MAGLEPSKDGRKVFGTNKKCWANNATEMFKVPRLSDELWKAKKQNKYLMYEIPEETFERREKRHHSKSEQNLTHQTLQEIDKRRKLLLDAYLFILEHSCDQGKDRQIYLGKVTSEVCSDIFANKKLWFQCIFVIRDESFRKLPNCEIAINVLNTHLRAKVRNGQILPLMRNVLPLFEEVLNRGKDVVQSSILDSETKINLHIAIFGAYINSAYLYAAVGQRMAATRAYKVAFSVLKSTDLLQVALEGHPNESSHDSEVWRYLRREPFLVLEQCKDVAHHFGVH